MTSSEAFDFVAEWISSFAPELRPWNFWLRVCDDLQKVHEKISRVYAHVFHHPGIVCVVNDFELLADQHKVGILLHEFGHIFARAEYDADADLWVEEFCGIDIEYVDTLQWVEPALLVRRTGL